MTEEEIVALIKREANSSGIDPNIFQWLVRSAFESGWRAGGGDPVSSDFRLEPVGWRLAWLASKERDILLRNGFITGNEGYK